MPHQSLDSFQKFLNDIISILSLLKIIYLRSDLCGDMFGVPLIVLVSLAPVPGQLEELLGEYKLHSAGQFQLILRS